MRFEAVFAGSFFALWCISRLSRSSRVQKKGNVIGTASASRKVPNHELPVAEKRSVPPRTDAPPVRTQRTTALARQGQTNPRVHITSSELASSTEMPTAEKLRDRAWLIPRLVQLCQGDAHRALEIYRHALKSGLDLREMSNTELESVFMALVTSMLRVGLVTEATKLMSELKRVGLGVSCCILASAVKICTAKHLFHDSLAMYDIVADVLTPALEDKSVWSCLVFCAVETRAHERCGFFFTRLKESGVPSQKDYWNMIRVGSARNDWESMLVLIPEMHEQGIEIDNVIYNTALATCVSANQLDQARRLLDHMNTSPGCTDVITYNTLMTGYAKSAKMEECFQLYRLMKDRGLEASQITYGILLDGCAMHGNTELAKRLYGDMVLCGVRPSTAIFSILIRLYSQCNLLDEAVELLTSEAAIHKVELEPRLFSQLIQSCIRSRQGRRAVEVYKLMLDRATITQPIASLHSTILGGCTKLNMFDTAAEILALAAARKVCVDRSDANQVLDGALKKRKTVCAESCAVSMRLLGFDVKAC